MVIQVPIGPPNSQCLAPDADEAELLADVFDDRRLDFDRDFDGLGAFVSPDTILDACCKVTSPRSTSFLRSDGNLSFCVLIRELRLFAGLLEDLRGMVRCSQFMAQYMLCVSICSSFFNGVMERVLACS